jgi:hypothetical protein
MQNATHFIEQYNIRPGYRKYVDKGERFSALRPIQCIHSNDLASTIIGATHITVAIWKIKQKDK